MKLLDRGQEIQVGLISSQEMPTRGGCPGLGEAGKQSMRAGRVQYDKE